MKQMTVQLSSSLPILMAAPRMPLVGTLGGSLGYLRVALFPHI